MMRFGGIGLQIAKSSIGAAVALLLAPAAVGAQALPNQGVADRPRPDYDPLGIGVGGFTLYPSLTARIDATDNYRATLTNKQADIYSTLQPEVSLRSHWTRNSLEARAYVTPGFHFTLPNENATQFGVSTAGVYDISRETRVRADLSAARFIESRASLGAFQGTAKPVRYDVFHGGIGATQTITDLTLTASASLEQRNFHNASLDGGGFVDQTYRNVQLATLGGSAQYQLRNGLGLIVSGQFDNSRYGFRPGSTGFVNGRDLNRDSNGFNLLGGVSLELSRLVFGTVQIGYIHRNYSDVRLINFSGFSYNADVLWNVTQLTSIRLRASRSLEETSSVQFAENIRSDIHVYVDHELYRYVLINGDVGFSSFRPNGLGIGGQEFTVGAGGRYLVNRRLNLFANVRYSGRTSDSDFLRYRAVFAGAGVRLAI